MKISICIPTYNQGLYLEQAVRSAFKQTLLPFEIIVSNDCSNDKTEEILKSLLVEVPILKVLNQPVNLGISLNTDACLRAASGELIVRLDSDDYLSPYYLEKISKALVNNPEAGFAHAAVQEVDQYGNFLKQRKLFRRSGFQTSNDALRSAVYGYRVAANIITFRKTALAKVNYITAKTNFAEDYYLSAALAAAGYGNVYLEEVLSFYRVWVDTGKKRQRRKMAEIIGYRKVFEEVLEPAFETRGWSKVILKKSRTRFACSNSDCLGWKIYNNLEKKELAIELLKLSSAVEVRILSWIYLRGFGKAIDIYSQLKHETKRIVKDFYKVNHR